MFHLFGFSTPVGNAFWDLATSSDPALPVTAYSRCSLSSTGQLPYADLNDPDGFVPVGDSRSFSVWICFGPIWLFAPFLDRIASAYPCYIRNLRGVIACSSSSAITKRFSCNSYDRHLVERLIYSEDLLLDSCRRLSLPCLILRPTMIYGRVNAYADRNLSRLLQLLRHFPVLPLPAETGSRQPIHASQLAAVALHYAQQLAGSRLDNSLPQRLALGGDTTLNYFEMISALKHAQHPGDPARRCRLISIPNRLFFPLASPLMLSSPKAFEAVLRLGANLSGFPPVHQLLGSEPQPFPVLPLA